MAPRRLPSRPVELSIMGLMGCFQARGALAPFVPPRNPLHGRMRTYHRVAYAYLNRLKAQEGSALPASIATPIDGWIQASNGPSSEPNPEGLRGLETVFVHVSR